jgi:hypothetical protein
MYQDKYNSFEIGLNSVLHKSENQKVKYSKTSITKMSEKAKVKTFTNEHRQNLMHSDNRNRLKQLFQGGEVDVRSVIAHNVHEEETLDKHRKVGRAFSCLAS